MLKRRISSSTHKPTMAEDATTPTTTAAATAPTHTHTPDIPAEPELSEYEKKRLEKIKRNHALLASLGLVNQKTNGSILSSTGQPQSKKRRRTSSNNDANNGEPTRVSGRKRAVVSYKDKSMKAILDEVKKKETKAPKKQKAEKATSANKASASANTSTSTSVSEAEKKPRRVQNRPDGLLMQDKEIPMSAVVCSEYWRQHRERCRDLRVAEKLQRKAELEHRHVTQQVQKEESRRKLEYRRGIVEDATKIRTEVLRLRATKTEETRQRMAELMKLQAEQTSVQDQFSKAMREQEKKLHGMLVSAVPEAKSTIRKHREKRRSLAVAAASSVADVDAENAEQTDVAAAAANGQVSSSATTTTKSSSIRKDKTKAKAILIDDDHVEDDARKVGGPISDAFSKKVQRSWLMNDSFRPLERAADYIPQVGDTVLYFASGHKKFLETNPDVRNTYNRNNRIIPWERRGGGGWAIGWEKLDSANEGILCTVVAAHAEFPVDPTLTDTAKSARAKAVALLASIRKSRGCKSAPVSKGPMLKKTPLFMSLTLNPLVPVSLPLSTEIAAESREGAGGNPAEGSMNKQINEEVDADLKEKCLNDDGPGENVSSTHTNKAKVKTDSEIGKKSDLIGTKKEGTAINDTENQAQSTPEIDAGKKDENLCENVKLSIAAADTKGEGSAIVESNDCKASAKKSSPALKGVAADSKGEFRGKPTHVTESSKSCENKTVAGSSKVRKSKRGGALGNKPRTTPPGRFSLLIFPCSVSNFIVPFTWALQRHTLIKPNGEVKKRARGGKWVKGTVQSVYRDERSTHKVYSQAVPLADRHALNVEEASPSPSLEWPTLHGVNVLWDDKRVTDENSWDLQTESNAITAVTSTLDELQRVAIANRLAEFLKESSLVSYFRSPVLEDAAPLYNSYVPVGMDLSRILNRLQRNVISFLPYYRSVGSLLSDLDEIYNNCILYNSPSSPIVTLANDMVEATKEVVSSILSGKFQAGCAKGNQLKRKWFQGVKPDGSWPQPNDGINNDDSSLSVCASNLWIPQAGDRIVYSKSSHEKFVASHADSLFYHQRVIPSLQADDDQDWIPGLVVDVRYTMPPNTAMSSFQDKTVLLELSIRFFDIRSNKTIFWRPFFLDASKLPRETHCIRGSSTSMAFLRPLWLVANGQTAASKSIVPVGLSTQTCQEISKTLGILRDRCVLGKSMDLALASPDDPVEVEPERSHNTRVVNKKLRASHFISDESDGYSSEVAAPKFCLELVLQRLHCGFYRQVDAVIDDMNVAFLSMSLFAFGGRGKVFLPHHDVLFKSGSKSYLEQLRGSMSDDDLKTLMQVLDIRKLYATALICVSEPDIVENAYAAEQRSLNQKTALRQKVNENSEAAPTNSQIIDEIMAVFQPDSCVNHQTLRSDEPNPTVKVRVSVKGGLPTKNEVVQVKIPCAKHAPAEHTDPQKIVSTEQGESKAVAPEPQNEYKSVVIDYSQPLLIEPNTYHGNEKLISSLFGSFGRGKSCARCQVRGNSFLVCRIRKGHANLDYDLSKANRKDLTSILSQLICSDGNDQDGDKKMGSGDDKESSYLEGVNKGEDEEWTAALKKSENAIQLAQDRINQAKVASSGRIALGIKFMDQHYPFDTDDGRYTSCTFCGYGGEMICCEGCPRVAHIRCANLKEIPEDDWFCYECSSKRRSGDNDEPAEKLDAANIDASESLEKLLEDLRAKRVGKSSSNKDGEEESDDDEEEEDEEDDVDYTEFRTRSARRASVLTKEKENEEEVAVTKRGRGRPRKVEAAPPTGKKRGRPRKSEAGPAKNKKSQKEQSTLAGKQGAINGGKIIQKKKIASKDWCPHGWTKKRVQRLSGISAGCWDNVWFAPNGKRYRTRTLAQAALRDMEEKKKAEAALCDNGNVVEDDCDEAAIDSKEDSKVAASNSSSTTRFSRKSYVTALFTPELSSPVKRGKRQQPHSIKSNDGAGKQKIVGLATTAPEKKKNDSDVTRQPGRRGQKPSRYSSP